MSFGTLRVDKVMRRSAAGVGQVPPGMDIGKGK